MARKGGSRHLKRYAMPKAIKLPRKEHTWVIKPAPGPHPISACVPLRLVLRDYLALARNAREADRLLAERQLLVDGKPRRDPKFPAGLMDVLQLPTIGRNYRVLLDRRGRLVLHEIEPEEASFKICKVKRKTIVKGKRIQIAFHDGKTIVGDFRKFKPGDAAKLSLPELKVLERVPFARGALALITGGKNVGVVGRITEIKTTGEGKPSLVTLEANGTTFQTSADYVFPIGKEEPLISLPG